MRFVGGLFYMDSEHEIFQNYQINGLGGYLDDGEFFSIVHPDWPDTWHLAALLHDAAEYVIGDLISPFKTAIGLDYKSFELKLLEAIHVRFGLPPRLPDAIASAIKNADRIAAFYEATLLAGFSREEALSFFGKPEETNFTLTQRLLALAPMPAADAQRLFLERFSHFMAKC